MHAQGESCFAQIREEPHRDLQGNRLSCTCRRQIQNRYPRKSTRQISPFGVLHGRPILDEATSALDSEAEAAIQEQLFNLMTGKTVIAIAHRLSTIAAMDRLIVLHQGHIVEEGNHDELLRRGGLYAELWNRQSGGFLPTAAKKEPTS
jgi:ABC-type phosphonate transport system ATPase subunit